MSMIQNRRQDVQEYTGFFLAATGGHYGRLAITEAVDELNKLEMLEMKKIA